MNPYLFHRMEFSFRFATETIGVRLVLLHDCDAGVTTLLVTRTS